MIPNRFDAISRLFASRRAALAPATIQATPMPDTDHGPAMLFVQSFQSGSIVPRADVEGRYTVTLEQGLGETIYFSDRPDRIVGSAPTAQFLDGLGFSEDNPPNAAILTSNGEGDTTLAVVELFDPVYDAETATLTYDVSVLEHWQDSTDLAFTEAPVEVGALGSTFGTAHLFIDDCSTSTILCVDWQTLRKVAGLIGDEAHDGWCYSWWDWMCLPCEPWLDADLTRIQDYWNHQCNDTYSACNANCFAKGVTNI